MKHKHSIPLVGSSTAKAVSADELIAGAESPIGSEKDPNRPGRSAMAGPEAKPLDSDDVPARAAVEHMIREWAEVARAIIFRRRDQ